ncbi:MAG: tRNA pseudouridine(38-40) synthase TruA [Planctomycetota bacterium]
MRNLKLLLAYDGTEYCGWQIQPNGPSIQQELSDAVFRVTGERRHPVASGRTDSGVHALGQVALLQTSSTLSPEVLRKAINANLPSQIVVHQIEEAPLAFDPVRDARWKLYRYVFHDGPTPDVFLRQYSWHVHYSLDVAAMAEAASVFEGTHDFRCFESQWPNRVTSVRTIRLCRPIRLGDLVYLDVEANGFLYNMVRAIAGTLYEIGRGKWPISMARRILEEGDRRIAGPNAPAQGLFLVRVEYAEESLVPPPTP